MNRRDSASSCSVRRSRRPALFPQLFPIPDTGLHLDRQRKSELMREHTHLPAMVGFVRKHVAQHFRASRPGPTPSVSAKLLDAAPTAAERFRQHLLAASGAFGQSGAGLLRRAVPAAKQSWDLQVWSGKPHPLAADIVHVGEDRGDGAGAGLAGRFGPPGGRVKMLDKNLVRAITGGKDLDCGSAELSVNSGLMTHAFMTDALTIDKLTVDGLTLGHGYLLLGPVFSIVPHGR